MAEFLGRTAVYLALGALALVLGLALRWLRARRDLRELPSSESRAQLIAALRHMRSRGATLAECVDYLRDQGLRPGVASGLVADVEREVPADVLHPREGHWNGHAFRYPGNWRLRSLTPPPWPEGSISIGGVGSNLVVFFSAPDRASFEQVVARQEALVAASERRTITRWGRFEGSGVVLRGPHARLRLDVEFLLFQPAVSPSHFGILQYHATEEAPFVRDGLKLIEDSLAPASVPVARETPR